MRNTSITVVITCFFTIFIAYSIRYGYGMLLPPMIQDFGISKVDVGVIYSSYFFAYTLFSPVLGWFSDRYNVKILLFSFVSLMSFGAFMMAYSTTVFNASCFFTLCGIGSAACWAPVMSLVQRYVADKRRGLVLSIVSMGSGIGIAAWASVIPYLVASWGWKSGWISLGCCGAFIAFLNLIFITLPPRSVRGLVEKDGTAENGKAVFVTHGNLFKSKSLWLVGLSYSLVGFVVLVPYTFLGTYTTEILDFSFNLSTRFFVVIAISGLVGKIVLGSFSDKIGRVKVMILCGFLLAVGCLGVALSQSVLAIGFFCGIFGLGFGAVWPVYAAAAPDFFPLEISGTIIGIWTVFLGIGSILSPIVCGWSIDHTGGYTQAFFFGTIAGIGSILLLLPATKYMILKSSGNKLVRKT